METNATITYAMPPQPQVVVQSHEVAMPAPVQTQVANAVRQNTYGVEKSVVLGVTEIILRVICLLLCIAVLIVASVTVLAINDVEDYYEADGLEYEHADDYRRAAMWLLLIAGMAIIYHSIAKFFRILYYIPSVKDDFGGYFIMNAILSALFGLALLAGAISNSVYSADNKDLYYDLHCDHYFELKLCEDLERVYSSEASAATIAFLSLVMFVLLFILTLLSGIRKIREASNMRSNELSAQPPPYPHLPK